MKQMKSIRLKALLLSLMLCLGLIVAPAAAASAEPAGQYDYICIGTDGSSYAMQHGVKLSTCKGSFLHKYIGGKMVQNIKLRPGGAPTTAKVNIDCVIAVINTVVAVFSKGKLRWLERGAAGLSIASACFA